MCLKFERGESSPFAGFYSIVAQWQVYGKSAKNSVEVLQIFWICTQENKGKEFPVAASYLKGKVQKEPELLLNKLVNL